MKRCVALCAGILVLGLLSSAAGQSGARAGGPAAGGLSADTRQRLVEASNRGAAYLRQQQKADGTWENHPGITALVATALLRQPGVPREKALQDVGKTLDYLRSLAKPDGGIYEKAIPHYVTAVSAQALAAGGRPADKPIVDRARQYIVANMLDESEGVEKSEIWYGGMGYGNAPRPDRRADIISLEYALQAMRETDLPATDAAWSKAIAFLQRTQNHSETNDQAWSGNDGGFVYYPGFSYHEAGGTRSYGSATYAGVLSYSWANVKKTDARVQGVLQWIRDNYTVDENPGMGQKTVYYYYMVFAKALQAIDEPVIVDAKGQRHNWREDLGRKLLAVQYPEGYWVNTDPAELQNNKVLVTTFTMSAIEALLK